MKLAIEIDGEIHNSREVILADKERQGYLEQFGILFLRFPNEQVNNDMKMVISVIEKKLKYLEEF